MPGFNGSGVFVRVHDWTTDAGNSVKVTASRMDAEDDGFRDGLSTTICKDGQTTTTAAIPFAVGVKVSNGTVSAPSISGINDTNSGLYVIGDDNWGFALDGAKVIDIGTAAVAFTPAISAANTAANNSCRVHNDSTINITTVEGAAGKVLTFNSESFDNGSMHATASDSGRITAPIAGVYLITGGVRLTIAGEQIGEASDYSLAIKLNGTSYLAQTGGHIDELLWYPEGPPTSVSLPLHITAIANLAANDYVELEIAHEFDATASATFVSGISPVFSAARLL